MFKKLLEKLRTNKNNTSAAKSVKEQQKAKRAAQNKKESEEFYKDMERGFLDDDF